MTIQLIIRVVATSFAIFGAYQLVKTDDEFFRFWLIWHMVVIIIITIWWR